MAMRQSMGRQRRGHRAGLGGRLRDLLPDLVDLPDELQVANSTPSRIPPKFLFFNWTLENYVEVQNRSNYLLFAYNSIVLSIGANVVGLLIAVPAAWSMAFAPTTKPDRAADPQAVSRHARRHRRRGSAAMGARRRRRELGGLRADRRDRDHSRHLLDHDAPHPGHPDVDAFDQNDAGRRRPGADLSVVPRPAVCSTPGSASG